MKYYKSGHSIIESEVAPEGYVEISKKEYDRLHAIITEIAEKRFELKKTDYLALKHSEGWITEEEYAPTKAHRQELRVQINELESQLD